MRRLIGFRDSCSCETVKEPVVAAHPQKTPVKSLVKVRFRESARTLTYYNDRFDLVCGDVVYVSGTMAGQYGVVIEVVTKFRIHTADYERVLKCLDLTILGTGTYVQTADKMVCCLGAAISPERFEDWITPPIEQKKEKDDTDPDEIVSGDGYSIELSQISNCEDLRQVILERGAGYYEEGRVKYIALYNGTGTAFVKGTKWYRVDFHYENGIITDLFCDCPYSGLCKHEVAVAMELKMLFKENPTLEKKEFFVAIDHAVFWRLMSRVVAIDTSLGANL